MAKSIKIPDDVHQLLRVRAALLGAKLNELAARILRDKLIRKAKEEAGK